MDSKQIEKLLERYWACETSVEEERQLRCFFNSQDVPTHLQHYKDLFAYQEFLQDDHLGKDFDERLLKQVEVPVVKAKSVSIFTRLAPIMRAVAAIALLLALGNLVERSLLEDFHQMAVNDTIGQQVTSPSVALGNDAESVDQQAIDSLNLTLMPVEQNEKIKK